MGQLPPVAYHGHLTWKDDGTIQTEHFKDELLLEFTTNQAFPCFLEAKPNPKKTCLFISIQQFLVQSSPQLNEVTTKNPPEGQTLPCVQLIFIVPALSTEYSINVTTYLSHIDGNTTAKT